MTTRTLIFALLFVNTHATCSYETQQYSCYASTGEETVSEIAAKRHLSPLKLCDWNRYELSTCDLITIIPKGFALKVPRDDCKPKPGVWTCYEVAAGDDLRAVAFGKHSQYRSTKKLIAYNKDILWGNESIFKGMHLRMPVPQCIPDFENKPPKICHTIIDGNSLEEVARMYNTSTGELLDLNQEVLGGLEAVQHGMQLHVNHPCPRPPSGPIGSWPAVCLQFWEAYVVRPGDTLYVIAQVYKIDYNLICQLNNIDCSKYGSIIQIGQPLTLPVVQPCVAVPGQHICLDMKISDESILPGPNSKRPALSFAGLALAAITPGPSREPGATSDGEYYDRVPAVGAAQSFIGGGAPPCPIRNMTFGGVFGDWQDNPFIAEYATKLFNMNKPRLADVQHSCGPISVGPPRPSDTPCVVASCASSADVFKTSPQGTKMCPLTQGGKCVTNGGCIIGPMMTIAVPYIPCIPDDAHTCFTYRSILTGGTPGQGLTDEMRNWVLGLDDFVNFRFYDDFNRAVLGSPNAPLGTGGKILPPGSNSSMWAINGDPQAPWPLDDVELRVTARLPGPNGWHRNATTAPDLNFAHQDPTAIQGVFCQDVPGASGHHCLKLVTGPGGPTDWNESLWTVSQETGMPVPALCSKYQLIDCNYINVVTAVEIPNS
jgi:LysM repeat protein